MRVDVKKFLFIGVPAKQKDFFEDAQKLGQIEFIGNSPVLTAQHPQVLQLVTAIKILRTQPVRDQIELANWEKAEDIAKKVIELHHEAQKLHEQHRLLVLEKERIEAFGHFSLKEIAQIEEETAFKVRFYCTKQGVFHDEPHPDLIYIDSRRGLDYFFAIVHDEVQMDGLLEIKIHTSLQEIEEHLVQFDKEIHQKESELKERAAFNQFLHSALLHVLNKVTLEQAQKDTNSALEERLFHIEGWVPISQIKAAEAICQTHDIYMEEVLIDAAQTLPTYLENKGNGRIGQDLVEIYDTPSTGDKDPSKWVLWAFLLFFAMIINDAGYGALFLAGTLFWRFYKPPVAALGKRMLRLSLFLSLACVAWGVLTSSYFGMELKPDNSLKELSVVNWLSIKEANYHLAFQDKTYETWLKEYPRFEELKGPEAIVKTTLGDELADTVLFELALIIGTLHVILSMLRHLRVNWAGFGWILFMIGCYLYLPSFVKATSLVNVLSMKTPLELAPLGAQILWTGLGLAVVLALIQKRLSGVLEVMTVIQIFCDVLSYLRLYALGLAGMMMAATFNDMAVKTGPFFGVIILLFGHAVNMVMAIMGGVIHGLRLNFLEWYHYSFEGGGRALRPLKLYDQN